MSKLEKLCYLIVQRQKANVKRRRLLYVLNVAIDKGQYVNEYHYHKRVFSCKKERTVYRKHADSMTRIAKKYYSPLRRELKAQVRYDGSNNCVSLTHDNLTYSYIKIKELADAYIFEEIVLRDKTGLDNPYAKLLNN